MNLENLKKVWILECWNGKVTNIFKNRPSKIQINSSNRSFIPEKSPRDSDAWFETRSDNGPTLYPYPLKYHGLDNGPTLYPYPLKYHVFGYNRVRNSGMHNPQYTRYSLTTKPKPWAFLNENLVERRQLMIALALSRAASKGGIR